MSSVVSSSLYNRFTSLIFKFLFTYYPKVIRHHLDPMFSIYMNIKDVFLRSLCSSFLSHNFNPERMQQKTNQVYGKYKWCLDVLTYYLQFVIGSFKKCGKYQIDFSLYYVLNEEFCKNTSVRILLVSFRNVGSKSRGTSYNLLFSSKFLKITYLLFVVSERIRR